jgi:2-polyprenyl-3-methyl-5-hydroxy-6-metoxy-1,4-benzoquinol methylase
LPTINPSISPAGEVDAVERERAVWDEHVPTLDQCVREYKTGPDPNTACMLQAVEPLSGKRVLDFGCGAGVTSAWLTQRGAIVTGIDVSPASVDRARQLAQDAGLTIELIAGELMPGRFPAESFDAVAGRYVLHHIDLTAIAPISTAFSCPAAGERSWRRWYGSHEERVSAARQR